MPTRPDRSTWLAAAERALKGAPLPAFRSLEGLTVEPLYGPGPSGRQSPLLRAEAGEQSWDIRVRVDHPDPAAANRQALEALEGGATSLLLSSPAASDDLARALDGVVLEAAPVALDAGFSGPEAARWLAAIAKGSPAARLAFHLDPLSAFAEAGSSPGPIEAHLALAAGAAAELAPAFPAASLFLASGRVAHEAGGSAALELGVAAAAALAYAKAMGGGFEAIALGLVVDGEILGSIAKLRAAREIWGRLTAACGAPCPARIEARSSNRMLTALDPWTNLLRLTAAGFAGAVGGADALELGTFTDALGAPAERARRTSRNIQLILMQECGLGQVEDPSAGAWAVEALTDQLARQGWAAFQAIERQGGLIEALRSGHVSAEAARLRQARDAAIAAGDLTILGVSLYPEPDPQPVELDPVPQRARRPAPRLPGPDGRCPPLRPVRLAETAERVAEDVA